MPRVLYIMPVEAPATRAERVGAFLDSLACPGTAVEVVTLPGGTADLEHYEQDHLAISLMLEAVPTRVRGGAFDAVVVACFYDPGVRELREVLDVPVVGVGEASMLLASLLGHRFSVVVGRRKSIPKMSDNALLYGFDRRIASWRSIDFTVQRIHDDPEGAYEAIAREAEAAVRDDRAEAIVLGCAAMENVAQRLTRRIGVPIVDPVVAGFKVAEMLGSLRERTGLTISKIYDYEPLRR